MIVLPLFDEVRSVPAATPELINIVNIMILRRILRWSEGRPASAQHHVDPTASLRLDQLAGDVPGLAWRGLRHHGVTLPVPVRGLGVQSGGRGVRDPRRAHDTRHHPRLLGPVQDSVHLGQ